LTAQHLFTSTAMAAVTSGQCVRQAVDSGLLRLPPELLTMITFQLHPREVIFLSLTCRTFHHGFLSEANSYLWFHLGGFGKSRLPGWSQKWLSAKYSMLKRKSSPEASKEFKDILNSTFQKSFANKQNASVVYSWRHLNAYIATTYPLQTTTAETLLMLRDKDKMPKWWFLWLTVNYCSLEGGAYVINYKKLLVESMFGHTDDGCQWCLGRPLRARYYEDLKLRLCTECFGEKYMRSVPSFILR